MIRSFGSAATEELFTTGNSRHLPPDLLRRAVMRLAQIHAANAVADLRLPPSNRLEALAGDRAGGYSIRVNDQWRICFRFKAGDAYKVEFIDYH